MNAIDLGTTQTKIATINPSGKPEIVLNARGEPHTPSVLHYTAEGNILYGTDAVEQSALEPQGCVRNFKLKLGSNDNLLNNGRVVTATDAAVHLLERVLRDAEQHLTTKIIEIVATVPANWRDDAKQALLEACKRVGLTVKKLVPEPTAGAVAYGIQHTGSALHLLVFDWGGGTLDVSILKVDGDAMTVLATEGVHRLGGNDLNQCLIEKALAEFQAKHGTPPTREAAPHFWLDLENRVEQTKLSLGARPQVPMVLSYQGAQLIVTFSQGEFHNLIDPLVQQSLDAVDRALAGAGLRKDQIDVPLMIGGTSRLKHIQNRLAGHIGKPVKLDTAPERAVAYGGALICLAEITQGGRKATLGGQVIPSPDVFVRDVTAHAVGCCVVDTSGAKKQLLNAPIIPKNTPIPCHRTDRFYLEREDQATAKIEILQGEPEALRDNCLIIGELLMDNLPAEPKRTQRIEVDYIIDGNGMVTATVRDTVGGQSKTVSVDYKKGVKPMDKLASI